MCGEHCHSVFGRWPLVGSSPRVRGTPSCPSCPLIRRRFIPACAGNTSKNNGAKRITHGSSPRVRGTHGCDGFGDGSARFIPACAGNTFPPAWTLPRRAVHPRVCGEHAASLPRSSASFRFIPACAGNTRSHVPQRSARSVHPRVCGEHPEIVANDSHDTGSSPRVRGTLEPVEVHARPRRFIPACAGNTVNPFMRSLHCSVHPRVCGEHLGT